MAKKSQFGVNLYHQQKPRKRPGRHTKSLNKHSPPEEEVTITYATEGVGHCDIHNNYKYSCPDCNKAIRNK